MNVLPMLVRLEEALGCTNLAKQMVLLPSTSAKRIASQDINLAVGYNGSPKSQTALDLTLWIAHQTRLATSRQVTVQVIYVVDLENQCGNSSLTSLSTGREINRSRQVGSSSPTPDCKRVGSAIAERCEYTAIPNSRTCQVEQFDQADQILWQARHLAEEWRGSLKTHLRFGQVATELRDVVEAESASVLLLGCNSVDNSIIQQLGKNFPCPVLGIPQTSEV